MFLVVLILLSVAAYFLFHAFRDWQAEQGVGYQRAGAFDSNAKQGASSQAASSSTGTPAGGYTSSRTGKQTTNFRDSGNNSGNNSDNKSSGSKGKNTRTAGGDKNKSQGNKGGSSAGKGSNKTAAGTAAGSSASAAGRTSSATSGSASNRTAGVASGAAQSRGQSGQGSGSSGSGSSNRGSQASSKQGSSNQGGSNQNNKSGTSSTTSSNVGSSASAKPAVTKETLRFTDRETQADDLKKISGIGPSIEKDLNSMGIYNFKQLANFQQSDVDNVNTALDFPGRIERDDWVPQAKKLMQGGAAGSASGNAGAGANAGSAGGSGSGSTSGGSAGATSGSTAKVTKETLRFTNREAQADDLKLINGIGPSIEKDLNSMGVYNFKQLANFQQSDIDNVNTALDFPGRIERDEWIPQAKRLMQGGAAGGTGGSAGTASSSGASGANSSASGGSAVTKETLRFTNRESQADNLQLISGVGPVIEQDLNSMGIYNFSQIANFQQSDIDNVNTAMDFPGRIERDEWIPQARRLMQSNAGSSSGGATSGSTGGGSGSSSSGGASGGASAATRGGSSWAAGAAATGAAVAAGAATAGAKSGAGNIPNASSNTPDALAGEIKERIKILNLRQSDSKRLAVSPNEFDELAAGRHANLGGDKLQDVTKILRWLCDEQL